MSPALAVSYARRLGPDPGGWPSIAAVRPGSGFLRHAVVALASAMLLGCSSGGPSAVDSTPSPTVGSTPSPAVGSTPPGETWSLVALGDSVPSGSNCDCTPYPQLSASSLTRGGTRQVVVSNDAVGGYTTADVLTQLRTDAAVASDVAGADVVEIEIGANDVSYGGPCGTSVSCYQPMIRTTERNLAEIVTQVQQLANSRPVLVVLLDYWNVWLGGRYADAKGSAYVAAGVAVTDQINTAVKGTAGRTGAAYVDLRAAFKGPGYAADETRYLASDGDHPNAAGHRLIAAAVVDVMSRTDR
jgi:lysophospholipase L1-like esterase